MAVSIGNPQPHGGADERETAAVGCAGAGRCAWVCASTSNAAASACGGSTSDLGVRRRK
ncbi:hypothetical protein VFPBJ_05036 [Purpureocillium lilacinum]|uniref:Uncharacterized protein n=1 Tax=Purpureocillium lilacinum TaxID=33203 RepID=A0A179GXF6_PURLI|nr:hypothetical protein VFPBJ_05036 [Purpureocillium lilacinum]